MNFRAPFVALLLLFSLAVSAAVRIPGPGGNGTPAPTFTYIETKNGTVASGVTIPTATFAGSLQVNDVIICALALSTTKTVSWTDDASSPNTYFSTGTNMSSNTAYTAMAVVTTTTSLTKVTASWTGVATGGLSCSVFRGGTQTTNAAAYDKSNATTGNSATPTVSLSPTSNGELVVLGCAMNAGGTPANSGSYLIANGATTNNAQSYRLVATTSESAQMGISSTTWACSVTAIKP